MGLRKSIRRMIARHQIQKRINAARYVHLMFNDKFNKPFVDFLNRHFDPSEHLVLCKRWFSEHPFPSGSNVVEAATFRGLDFSVPSLRQVICHSLFDSEVVDLLYEQKAVLQKKAWWIVWGGDFYGAPRDEKNDYVRGHFRGYYSGVDRERVKARYHTNDNYFSGGYVFPIDSKMLDAVIGARGGRCIDKSRKPLVQVNNSCDESSLRTLRDLSKFAGKIRLRVIVSYGDLRCKDEIMEYGKGLFGADFEAIEDYLSPAQYAQKLDEIDVLVLAQNRQQGFGNTLAALYLGKKVFVRSDVSVFSFLHENHVKVEDTLKIAFLDLESFLRVDQPNQRQAYDFAWTRLNEGETAKRYARVFAIQ